MPRPKGPTKSSTPAAKQKGRAKAKPEVANYDHTEPKALVRPEIGTQAHFKQKKGPAKYHYDDSLAPDLNWDTSAARELGEWLLARIAEAAKLEAPHTFATPKEYFGAEVSAKGERQPLATVRGLADAVEQLQKLGKPFLNWSGKAERKAFEVPTLPLFVHERLSTEAILKTLKGHKKDQQVSMLDELFGVTQRSLTDQVVHAYEHQDNWVNRLILGDSLVVMNSLLRYEHLGGQVQMIYMDPPYGVKFGSNFQPFVRKREVKHNEDESLTREPEMVQAYRDTWELGLHSYLTYLRDRLLLARDLLTPSGSVFVQISDENLHHVREVMDEVFGAENAAGLISFYKTSSQSTKGIPSVVDYLVVYARDKERMKFAPFLRIKEPGERGAKQYTKIVSPDFKEVENMTEGQLNGTEPIPKGWQICRLGPTTSQGYQEGRSAPYDFQGTSISIPPNRHWAYDPTPGGDMDRLVEMGRIRRSGQGIATILLASDNPTTPLDNVWLDTGTGSFTDEQSYVVQTSEKVIRRCMLMVTDPGDLVLDPTCGSGTTACVAEEWGRRWITIDTSRVPLSLARQRLLTKTFAYWELLDTKRGPAGGFVFKQKKNARGQEVGGIVPHITLGNVAGEEDAKPKVILDRPEKLNNVTRVCGPFAVEATIPTAEGLDEDPKTPGIQSDEHQTHVQRMTEVLRRAPVLQLAGNKKITLKQVRPPAKTMSLSAEAIINGDQTPQPVAILFGPEGGALTERMVREAWQEAEAKKYTQLLVIGFAIDPKAREFVESAGRIGIPCTWLQATMDLQMGDLLKNMRSSQVFSVCGLPEVKVKPVKEVQGVKVDEPTYEVELLGLDTFDPATMDSIHFSGSDVPCWLLDTDYNGLVFRVHQAFFPRTGAWENLKKELRADFAESVWDHLSGTVSAPFTAGEQKQIAVKVIDPRGNELVVVKKLVSK
ncbi:MAG: site-specific DNA-methyltransferase [Flavobacteriales bacterium]|nr:MAG: site-specific DNA-methyltransferase [Flavobacteriales bacterium]